MGIKLDAATAPEAARTVRRSGDDSFVGMTFLLSANRGAPLNDNLEDETTNLILIQV
jgi:hypothetical protein